MNRTSRRQVSPLPVRVGVLALQGASELHQESFARLGQRCRTVRSRASLAEVTHLVLPGGESTTISSLLDLFDLREALLQRVAQGSLALFGVCAGAILLGRSPKGERQPDRPRRLGCLEASVRRNAYGRQRASRVRSIQTTGRTEATTAVLIRAPAFVDWSCRVEVLARFEDGSPAALEAPGLLATSFHPELNQDDWFHERFLRSARDWETVVRTSGVGRRTRRGSSPLA